MKPGFLLFQNHLHSKPHGCSIRVPPQQVCRACTEPVRPYIIARGGRTIFLTHPLVEAFASIPGDLVLPPLVCQKEQPWSPWCLAPIGTRFALETTFTGDCEAAVARSFVKCQLCTAVVSLTLRSEAPLPLLPLTASPRTNPPSPRRSD